MIAVVAAMRMSTVEKAVGRLCSRFMLNQSSKRSKWSCPTALGERHSDDVQNGQDGDRDRQHPSESLRDIRGPCLTRCSPSRYVSSDPRGLGALTLGDRLS